MYISNNIADYISLTIYVSIFLGLLIIRENADSFNALFARPKWYENAKHVRGD